MTQVDAALDEIAAALDVMEPLLEGARHLAELTDLQPDTRTEVERSIEDYNRRFELLRRAQTSLEALNQDQYPDVPIRDVNETILRDLQQDTATIMAAMAKYQSDAANSLGLTGGKASPKG